MRNRPSPARRTALIRVGTAAAALLAVAGAGTMLGGADATDVARPTSDRSPLREVTLVCPDSLAGEDGEPSTTVQAVSAPIEVERPSGDGALRLRELGADKPRESANKPGRGVATQVQKAKVQPILVESTGALAPASGALARTEGDSGAYAGLAETGCHRPGSEFWFVGASADEGRKPRLYVTNVERTSARVTVEVWDSKGRVKVDQMRAVDIAGGDRMVVDLDELAPLSTDLAVRVTAERGRVTAGLLDRTVSAGESHGIDWVPSSTAPAREQLIPGLVPGDGKRVLTVAAPEETSATVRLTLLGKNGEFQPTKPESVQVEAGTVKRVDLSDGMAGEAVAVRLDSEVPVTASVRSIRKDDSDRDYTYTPSVRPFRTPAVVGSTAVGDDRSASLILSNPGKKQAKASVRLFDDKGEKVKTIPVEVSPGATANVDLPASEKGYSTVVDPNGTPLIGARVLTGQDARISSIPLRPAPLTALRPVVEEDPAAGLP